jgi:phosphoribosyl-ATP pyrophosphohydrolase
LVREAADVLYHLLVVLHARGISLDEVEAELGARSHQSGLEEKAARKAAHKSARKSG